MLLEQIAHKRILDADELSLFEWYTRENGKMIERMLTEEHASVQKQINAGNIDAGANNSGWLAVEYTIKRARYADVIYLASLLEICLGRACKKLIDILGDHNVVFRPDELVGDKWTKREKFLTRYGRFDFPEGIWSELRILIRVRNILVHENGSTDLISSSDKDQIQMRPGIAVGQELVIEDAFVMHCLAATQSLVEFVDRQIGQLGARTLQPESLGSNG